MARGGKRSGAGRTKGTKAKRTIALEQVAALQAQAGYLSPVKFLLDVMKDSSQEIDLRVEAAKAAAPYTDKKMPQAVEVAGAGGIPLSIEFITPLTRRTDGANPTG